MLVGFIVILTMAPIYAQAQEHAAHDTKQKQSGHKGGKHKNAEKNKHKGAQNQQHKDNKNEQREHRKIHLKKDQRKSLNLKVVNAEAGNIRETITAPATIAFDPDRVAHVGPLIAAKVKNVRKELGAQVEKGETLAVLESVALGKVKARYIRARARLETARADYQRQRKLADDKIASEAELLDSRAAFKEAQAELNSLREQLRLYGLDETAIAEITQDNDKLLSRYVLTSPISGTLQKRAISPGDSLTPKQTPLHVVNTNRMWVNIDVFEADIPYIARGQTVRFSTRVHPEKTFKGRVAFVSRELDPKTRTVRVQAVIDNPGGKLRAGMFGKARIQTTEAKHTVLVPIDAVQTIKGNEVVFVPGKHDGAYRAQPVKTGEENNGHVEILSGVKPGQNVVASGAFDLKSAITASGRSAAHSH